MYINKKGSAILEGLHQAIIDEGKIKVGDKVSVEGFTGVMTVTNVSSKGLSIEGITGLIPEKKVTKANK